MFPDNPGKDPNGSGTPEGVDAMVDEAFRRREERERQLQHLDRLAEYFRGGYIDLQFKRAPDLEAAILDYSPDAVQELHDRHQGAYVAERISDAVLEGPEAVDAIREEIQKNGGFIERYSLDTIEARLRNTIPGENWYSAHTCGRPWDRKTMEPQEKTICAADIQVCIPDDREDARCPAVQVLYPRKNDWKFPKKLARDIYANWSGLKQGFAAQIGVVSDLCSTVPLQGFASQARDEAVAHIAQLDRKYPIEVMLAALFSIEGLEYIGADGKKQVTEVDPSIDNAISHVVHKKCKYHYEPVWTLLRRKVPIPGREGMSLIVNWDVVAARMQQGTIKQPEDEQEKAESSED
ncbi:hypothetical protein KKC44_02880 [Patescibacteria group bacterium]|nr:hypothetical protein [Patescibacteria group bacterium]MBU2259529.1 hypothetical protein [Patescibacteria group bacterium]